MKKYKKASKSYTKGLYRDCTNGMDSKKFWNIVKVQKGVVPQSYMSATLPMNNDKS